MSKILSNEQLELLIKPLPSEAVKPHPTKTFLSSIKAIYVTERMNEVFGVGGWSLKVEHITTTEKSMVVVKVTFVVKEYDIYYECFGGNDNGGENSKNFDLGDAYKGATTDAITKIGSYLGIGIDVFKGKNTLTTTNNEQKQKIENWLSEDQLKIALNSDEKGIKATLLKYNTVPFGMKKEYRDELNKKLSELNKNDN